MHDNSQQKFMMLSWMMLLNIKNNYIYLYITCLSPINFDEFKNRLTRNAQIPS